MTSVKNVWTTQSPFRAPPTLLLPNSQTASRPCYCWATTRKHVENVDFNGLNQIGWLVALHSHSKDGRSDRIVTMRWITSNMYSKDKHTVSIWSWWRCRYISISAGNYFHRYIIIPATINHHRIYNYKWLYINCQLQTDIIYKQHFCDCAFTPDAARVSKVALPATLWKDSWTLWRSSIACNVFKGAAKQTCTLILCRLITSRV